jgi:hypothetical protein
LATRNFQTYARWTANTNGAGLDVNKQLTNPPREWNQAYFDLLAHCLPGLESQDVEELALTAMCSLPDEAFFDVMTGFLRSIDVVYFNDTSLQETVAIGIRSALAKRLMASRGWKRLGASRSASIETHIGPAIAVFFFNDRNFFEPAKCYLLREGVDRLDPFLLALEGAGPGRSLAFCCNRDTQPPGSVTTGGPPAVRRRSS